MPPAKDIVGWSGIGKAVSILCQSLYDILVYGDDVFLSGLVFPHYDVGAEFASSVVIDIAPCQLQGISDAQRSVDAGDDECIVPEVWFLHQVIIS